MVVYIMSCLAKTVMGSILIAGGVEGGDPQVVGLCRNRALYARARAVYYLFQFIFAFDYTPTVSNVRHIYNVG